MPRGIYSNISCRGDEKEKIAFEPTKHQQDTLEYFLKSPYKGICLYWQLGSGKTCGAILIADKMLKRGLVDHVYVLTSGSLRQGWVMEYCKKCGFKNIFLETYFTFITYNYGVQDNLPNFDNSLVIIDEVHNLINGAKNFTKTGTAIYNKLNDANCKIIALSGTPIYNNIYEFALLGRLLKPGDDFPDIRVSGEIDQLQFMKEFSVSEDGSVKPINPTKMKRKLEGIISYYPGASTEFMPKIINQPPIMVLMPPEQEIHYWNQVVQERKLSFPPPKSLMREKPKMYDLLRKMYIMARKNILSRKASNFYYPRDIADAKDLLSTSGGWISHDKFDQGQLKFIYSGKITALVLNIILHDKQKQVIFTFFKKKAGAQLLYGILMMCGIKCAVFSGELSDQDRERVLKKFNSPENNYGDVLRILIVTEAGVEGISILNARHIHILESSPRMTKTMQAIGRVARFMSHITLPPEERTVNVWRYWSIASPEPFTLETKYVLPNGEEQIISTKINNKTTIDQILYVNGMKNIQSLNSFLDLLKEVSVTPYPKGGESIVENIPFEIKQVEKEVKKVLKSMTAIYPDGNKLEVGVVIPAKGQEKPLKKLEQEVKDVDPENKEFEEDNLEKDQDELKKDDIIEVEKEEDEEEVEEEEKESEKEEEEPEKEVEKEVEEEEEEVEEEEEEDKKEVEESEKEDEEESEQEEPEKEEEEEESETEEEEEEEIIEVQPKKPKKPKKDMEDLF